MDMRALWKPAAVPAGCWSVFGTPRLTRSVSGRGGAQRLPSPCLPLFDAPCCVVLFPPQICGCRSPGEAPRRCSRRPRRGEPPPALGKTCREPVLTSALLSSLSPLCFEPCLLEWCCAAGYLKLINDHDLFIFWECTVRCSSFKRLEYFVLKKRRKRTLSFKTQTATLTLLLVLWYRSWFFGLYLIEAFEILWNWTQRA